MPPVWDFLFFFRTHDLSRRAAADLRLRPRGHWDRLLILSIAFQQQHCLHEGTSMLRLYVHFSYLVENEFDFVLLTTW